MSLKCEVSNFSLPGDRRSNAAEITSERRRPGLVIVLNSSIAVGFLRGQLEHFQNKGFAVTVLCPERRSDEWDVERPSGIAIHELTMERGIAPLRDLISFWNLWRALQVLRPSVTNVGTPKAGLLGGFAAWLNRVPARFYTLHGLRFETTKGLKRLLLILAERLACRFAHRVVCVSNSVREKAIACRLTSPERSVVFGSGSCNGIDALRFAPNPELAEQAGKLRHHFGIPVQATVILFLGRLTRDKGIPELMDAFSRLDASFSDLRLLLAGCFEKEDPLPAHTLAQLRSHPHVILAGPVRDTPAYYAAADVVVLPSHREGLPTVILEAQAAAKPVVAANATGIVDLVRDGKTGLIFRAGDADALAETMAKLIKDRALMSRLELAGQEQVKRDFPQEAIWNQLYEAYLEVLEGNASSISSLGHGSKNKKLVHASH